MNRRGNILQEDFPAGDVRVMQVSRGLFILRYISSDGRGGAPRIVVRPSAGSKVELITEDMAGFGIMSAPGEALVVRASEPGSLDVSIGAGGSSHRHAHLVFERVTATLAAVAAAAGNGHFASTGVSVRAPSIEILAHVARRGDVVVGGGEWISGPQFPLAIEGLQLLWPDRPTDVDLQIEAVHSVRGRRQSLGTAQAGAFIGTRGMAAPLTALALGLTGPLAARYSLQCEALFLGAQVQRRSGATVKLSGPTGLEPLVGLCLSIVPAAAASQVEPPMARAFTAPQPEPRQEANLGAVQTTGSAGRVRVFRKSRIQQSVHH